MVSKINISKKAFIKILIVIAVIAIIGVGSVFTYKYTGWFGDDNTNTASNSPTTTESPTQTPEPTSTTTPEVVKLNAPDLISYGLKYNSKTEKYETVDNRYGVETKEAGIFYKNVELEGKEVGGFAFIPDIVKKMLRDSLAKIPEGENKLKIIMPLDISTIPTDIEIKIEDYIYYPPERAIVDSIPGIILKCPAQVDLVNVSLEAEIFASGSGPDKNGQIWRSINDNFIINNPTLIKNEANRYVRVCSTGTDFNEHDPYTDLYFGKKLVSKNPESEILFIAGDFHEVIPICSKDILTIQGKPVFLVASDN